MSMPRPRPTQTPAFRVEKSDAQWRETLSAEQYSVLRRQGTERAFTSALNQETRPGRFCCAGCGAPLFRMADKFDSGTGWPSFTQPEEDAAVGTQTDRSLFMTRTEVHCAACGGHLGHRFPDGPAPTGQRYCINGVALTFDPEEGA